MTRKRINFLKNEVDKITEDLGGVDADIWKDPYKMAKYIYILAETCRELLIDNERE